GGRRYCKAADMCGRSSERVAISPAMALGGPDGTLRWAKLAASWPRRKGALRALRQKTQKRSRITTSSNGNLPIRGFGS
ncbi:MAG TPA: hypothetical protein DFM08_02545, partial [Pseudomonas sp.]|nr:hypothetical protein [Pseudomonas sp.]